MAKGSMSPARERRGKNFKVKAKPDHTPKGKKQKNQGREKGGTVVSRQHTQTSLCLSRVNVVRVNGKGGNENACTPSLPPTTTTSYDVEGRKGGGILEDRQTQTSNYFLRLTRRIFFLLFNVLRIASNDDDDDDDDDDDLLAKCMSKGITAVRSISKPTLIVKPKAVSPQATLSSSSKSMSPTLSTTRRFLETDIDAIIEYERFLELERAKQVS